MATIIDVTYFERGNLYIPNNKDITVEPSDSPSSRTELEVFISKYERQLLLNALGVTLFDQLQTALTDLDNVANVKWKDLVNGRNYTTVDGRVKRWEGLKGYDKQSLIAYFVFTEYLRNDNETYTTVGTTQSNAKNSERVNATPKYIKAYNQFIEAYQGKFCVAEPRLVVNSFGSVGVDWYNESVQVSLYNYLIDCNDIDPTMFPDFEFLFYEYQNSFGI